MQRKLKRKKEEEEQRLYYILREVEEEIIKTPPAFALPLTFASSLGIYRLIELHLLQDSTST
jgi:hypothetical protein